MFKSILSYCVCSSLEEEEKEERQTKKRKKEEWSSSWLMLSISTRESIRQSYSRDSRKTWSCRNPAWSNLLVEPNSTLEHSWWTSDRRCRIHSSPDAFETCWCDRQSEACSGTGSTIHHRRETEDSSECEWHIQEWSEDSTTCIVRWDSCDHSSTHRRR